MKQFGFNQARSQVLWFKGVTDNFRGKIFITYLN